MRVGVLVLLASCTEYDLTGPKVDDPLATPAESSPDPTVPPEEPPATTPVEPPATTPVVTTPADEAVFCSPFDDFGDWNQAGDGAWAVVDGMMTEGRFGEYDAIAWLHDLGAADHFGVQVDVAWSGNANDLSGVVWGYDAGAGYAVRWDDPQDYYQRYVPPGGMDLSRCEGSDCEPIAADSSADLYHPADMTFATLLAEVEGDVVRAWVDGVLVMEVQAPEVAGSGPGVVGLFSDDNDGGVWFDDFCVWIYE